MNRVQEAVAEVLGVASTIQELRSTIDQKENDAQLAITERDEKLQQRDEEFEDLRRTMEAVISDNRVFQRTLEDIDYLNLYDDLNKKTKNILPKANTPATVKRLRQMRHENPLAKQGIRLIVRFTLGKGITWICKNPEIRDTLNEFWEDPENSVILTDDEAMKEFVDEVATDGEKFLACFEAPNAAPYLKIAEIPMEEVQDIIYDPDNRRVPVYYRRKYQEQIYDGTKEQYTPKPGSKNRGFKVLYYRDYRVTDERIEEIKDRIQIPASKIAKDPDGKEIKIFHVYVNPLWTNNGRRGISELYASREWFRVFREFMQDRAIINRAAGSVALKRKIKGGPAAVAGMTGTFGGMQMGSEAGEFGELKTLTRPVAGAIYDYNEGVDLDWLKTDTGAANAKEDARMLLMVGGAGIGTNIHYFGEGGDANLATAQAMELPMVKNYEDWQSWLEAVLMAMFGYVLRLAYGDNIPFENRSTEAVAPETNGQTGTTNGKADANGFKTLAGKSETPIIELPDDQTPEQTTVKDVVSWEFPPIISKDVVKHMTAWAQLTQQVAPGDLPIKVEAIKGALTVLGVPNVDQIMEVVRSEETRLQEQRDLQRQAMLDAMENPANSGPGPDIGGNGKNGAQKDNVPGFTKAGSGADAETKRLAKGKPSPARVGRVAADKRPGAG